MSFESELNAILTSCDKEQLNKYLNDEESLDLLIKSLSQYDLLLNEKDTLQKANKNLAESNLAKQPKLDEAKFKLSNAIKEFEEARKEYSTVKETYEAVDTVNGDMSLESVYNLLQANSLKSEEETDKNADDFFCEYNSLHTEEEVNLFQKQFLESRTQAHIKKIKADKMKELLPNY